MAETGSHSPYAGPDDKVAAASSVDSKTTGPAVNQVIKPLPPEAGGVIKAIPPSGATVIEAKCCPPAVEFYGALVMSQPKYFGYDPLNNRSLPEGDSHVYWSANTRTTHVDIEYGSLTKPSSRTDMDGSAWFSVGVGETTRFAAEFLGSGCFQNVVFESEDPTIAVPVDGSGKSTIQEMAVKGLKEGETTIFARCQGKLVGWVHIWVIPVATITLDIGVLKTPQTITPKYNVAAFEAYMNLVFGQARIRFQVNDAGVINLPAVSLKMPLEPATELLALEPAIKAAAKGKLSSSYHILFFVPDSKIGSSVWGGEVPAGIGLGDFAYVYDFLDERAAFQMAAHEMGHLLNLSHPAEDLDGDEFPVQQWNNVNLDVYNVIRHHAYNLMGYGNSHVADYEMVKLLGYMQWEKLRRH